MSQMEDFVKIVNGLNALKYFTRSPILGGPYGYTQSVTLNVDPTLKVGGGFVLLTLLLLQNDRSSRPEIFCKKVFLKIPQNSRENKNTFWWGSMFLFFWKFSAGSIFLFFWKFSAPKCSYTFIILYEVLLPVNGENCLWR